MTTPNRIVFEATGKPAEIGRDQYILDDDGTLLPCSTIVRASDAQSFPAYRRIDTPADSRLLEVATALAAGVVAHNGCMDDQDVAESVDYARKLIAACEGAAQ